VPQGSVLGPLLFLISINDLPYCLNSSTYLYADDTTLLTHHSDITTLEHSAKNSVSLAAEWFSANSFLLNNDKTQTVIFSLRHIPEFHDVTNVVKFLGVHIDQHLSWSHHIKHLCTRLSRLTFLFRKLIDVIPFDYVKTTYYSLFQSALNYGILFWGNSSHVNDVLLIQKKVVRIMAKVNAREHCRPIFVSLRILTVINLYIYNAMLHSFKNLNKHAVRGDVHNFNTRHRQRIDIPYVRLEKTKASYEIVGLKCLNKMPIEVLQLPYKSFKTNALNWLTANPFYRIEEFFEKGTYDILC
jgi:hypothetical protein